MTANEDFFAKVPTCERFADVPAPQRFVRAPDSWSLILTRVEDSTEAIERGRYKDVNSLGVASIVAVRNALPDIDIPYVFGGDGATLLAPSSRFDRFVRALRGVSRRALEAFGLELRAGVVSVGELRSAGHEIYVARYRASRHAVFAMLSGSGLVEGERWLKDPELGLRYAVDGDGSADADFSGFECRWEPIQSRRGKMLALLVCALGATREEKARTYGDIITQLEAIVGDDGRPVTPETLRIAPLLAPFEQEARLLSGRDGGPVYVARKAQARLLTSVGRFLLWSRRRAGGFDGRRYLEDVTANTDFRRLDETLRMVLDVSPAQHERIVALLEAARQEGRLTYGTHASSAALMTCVVSDYAGRHVHFVDGAEGGYALAARELKARLRH